MPRYLIELTHENDHVGCVNALQLIERYGAHLLTKADWGCKDGTHAGWLVVELESRDEALRLVPPQLRSQARIVQLNSFSKEDLSSLVAGLKD